MENNTINILKIADFISPIISSRDAVDVIKNAILKMHSRNIKLDFSNISMISRSAAHEFLIIKEDLLRNRLNTKEIEFINTDELVSDIFRIVASSRAIPKKEEKSFSPERIDIDEILKEDVAI